MPKAAKDKTQGNSTGTPTTTTKRDSGGIVAAGRAYQSNVAEVFFPPGSMATPLADLTTGGGGASNVSVTIIANGVNDPLALTRMVGKVLKDNNVKIDKWPGN